MERKALSKRKRFEVFKRDGFRCQYCGHSLPQVLLEVDHVIPVSGGGDDGLHNLVTACFDCNRGKSSVPLESVPESLKDAADRAAERREQVKAMDRIARAERGREDKVIAEMERILLESPEWVYKDAFRNSIRHFSRNLPLSDLYRAAEIAASKIKPGSARDKYFCGICWKMIRKYEL